MNILFVDDDNEIRDNYSLYLEEYYENIEVADTANKALEIYNNKQIDIIILEIDLPDMNGLEIARRIREKDHNTKIVILTKQVQTKFLIEAVELCLSKYLIKPITKKDLKKVLDDVTLSMDKKECYQIHLENNFAWNAVTHKLSKEEKDIRLTKSELGILKTFCKKEIDNFTIEEIGQKVFPNEDYNENKIKMIIKRFRKKTDSNIIKNTYGLGYKFNIRSI